MKKATWLQLMLQAEILTGEKEAGGSEISVAVPFASTNFLLSHLCPEYQPSINDYPGHDILHNWLYIYIYFVNYFI